VISSAVHMTSDGEAAGGGGSSYWPRASGREPDFIEVGLEDRVSRARRRDQGPALPGQFGLEHGEVPKGWVTGVCFGPCFVVTMLALQVAVESVKGGDDEEAGLLVYGVAQLVGAVQAGDSHAVLQQIGVGRAQIAWREQILGRDRWSMESGMASLYLPTADEMAGVGVGLRRKRWAAFGEERLVETI